MTTPDTVTAGPDPALAGLAEHLQRRLRTVLDDAHLVVGELRPFGGGHSGVTCSVELDGVSHRGRYVLRTSPQGVAIAGPADVGRQGRIMGALAAAGLPAPTVVAAETEPTLDGRAYALMEKVEGTDWETFGRRGHPHHSIAAAAIEALRALQTLPTSTPALSDLPVFDAAGEVRRWQPLVDRSPEEYRIAGATLAEQLIETSDQARDDVARVLVHGDLHYANLIFSAQGVAAVVDWEIAAIGHPLTDLGCLAVASLRRRYAPDPNPTGDVEISLSELVALYGAAPSAAAWHIAASCYKYAAIIGYNLHLHRRGKKLDPVYESLQLTLMRLLQDGNFLLRHGLGDL